MQQNGLLSHPQDLAGPMRVAAQRKIITINTYRQQCADNQNIPFLPEIVTTIVRTSCRMHGEFLRLLFLQGHTHKPELKPGLQSMY